MRKVLLYGVLSALALVALVAVGLGLDAGTFQVERSVEISAPVSTVFAQVEDLHRWGAWFPWVELDSHVSKQAYSGPDKGVGAAYTWENDNKSGGQNRLTIRESVPPQRVLAQLEFTQGRTREFQLQVTLQPRASDTHVQLVLTGPDTVASKWFSHYKDYLGKDLTRALAQLKKVSETAR